jgi:hypothetical protein
LLTDFIINMKRGDVSKGVQSQRRQK